MKTELLIALAKMLPDKIYLYFNPQFAAPTLFWGKKWDSNPERVKPIELLELCWMVEENLHPNDTEQYAFNLQKLVAEYWKSQGKDVAKFSPASWLFVTAHASAEQRIEALAKVKGVV